MMVHSHISPRTMYITVLFSLFVLLAAQEEGGDQQDSGLLLRMPPSITVNPIDAIYFKDQEPFTLECEAEGSAPIEIEWMQNGQYFDFQMRQGLVAQNSAGHLVFEMATILDQGYYQCFASNTYGKTMSSTAVLMKAVLSSFPEEETPTLLAIEGESFRLPCSTVKSVPAYDSEAYSWATVVTEDSLDLNTVTFSRRINVDEFGNLHFAHVTLQDHQDGFVYMCNIRNAIMATTVGGSFAKINVEPRPGDKRSAPVNSFVTSSPSIGIKGKSIKLKCLFSGNPEPRITWTRTKDGAVADLPRGRYVLSSFNSVLTITGLRFEDEGTYACQGSNDRGTSTKTFITLDVQSIPEFEESPHNVNFTVGNDAKINCTATAEPDPTIVWYINGEEVLAFDGSLQDTSSVGPRRKINAIRDGGQLIVSRLCKDCFNENDPDNEITTDLMSIQCNASNEHGYAFAQGYMNVLEATYFIVTPPEQYIVELDEVSVELECDAGSDPSTPVEITWYLGDTPISEIYDDRRDRYTVDPDHTLIIDLYDLTLEEKGKFQGDYRCEADNGYSPVVAVTALEVEGAPAPIVAAAGFPWWIFLIIALVLLLLILLLCCCICCLQRNKGDEYLVDEKERANGNDPEKELQDSGFHEHQRPEEPAVKGSRASLTSTIKLDSDDEGSLAEYGDIDAGKFNEDGSFIGQYATADKKKRNFDSTV